MSRCFRTILYFNGDPLESKAYAAGIIKGADVKIILAHDGDQVATWTGVANDGNPANANNWLDLAGEPVVPTSAYTVKIAGSNVNLQCPAGTDIACKAFEIGNCTFTTDCDWRGLTFTPTIIGTANLNGHNLYLGHLNAVGGSFVNNAADTTSRVLFDVAENGSYSELSEQVFIDNIGNLSTGENVFLSLLKPDDENDTTTATLMLFGKSANVTAEFVQTNGTVNLGSSINKIGVNSGNRGVYRMLGGSLTVAGNSEFVVGASGTGVFNQSGGSVTVNNWFSLGRYGGNGTYTMTGGSLTANHTSNAMWLGADKGTGTLTIETGATATFKGGIDNGRYSGATGHIILNGGTFNVEGAKVTFSVEDIASLATTRKTYTLVRAANGGTITGSVLQPDTDAQLPKGWHVTATSSSVTLRKGGFTIRLR